MDEKHNLARSDQLKLFKSQNTINIATYVGISSILCVFISFFLAFSFNSTAGIFLTPLGAVLGLVALICGIAEKWNIPAIVGGLLGIILNIVSWPIMFLGSYGGVG